MKPDTPVQYVKGVGPKTAEKFLRLGVETLADLLQLYPRRYIDYTRPFPVAQAPFDADAVVKAAVYSKKAAVRLPGGRTMGQGLATTAPPSRSPGSTPTSWPTSWRWARNITSRAGCGAP